MVTAYDMPGARFAEDAGIDMILVGDTAAMVVLGHEGTTVPVTMDEMLFLTRTVARAVHRPIVVGDMPFGSYQVSDEDAVRNAIRFVKEAGADVVKLEGAGPMVSRARAIVRGRDRGGRAHRADAAVRDACSAASRRRARPRRGRATLVDGRAGARGGRAASRSCSRPCRRPSPTRSRGASRSRRSGSAPAPACDGQVLVYHDLLGLTEGHLPRFVKRYANLSREIRDALEAYAAEVRSGAFPGAGAHVRDVGGGARGVPDRGRRRDAESPSQAVWLSDGASRHSAGPPRAGPSLVYSALGSTANAATITPASPSAPTTPRHGSRNVVRSPSATSASDHGDERQPDRRPRRRARCPRRRRPTGTSRRRSRARSQGRARRARARSEAPRSRHLTRDPERRVDPDRLAPSQSASPSRK